MYGNVAGIDNINAAIQEWYNPKDEYTTEVRVNHQVFRVGDRVLQLKNQPEDDIFNGDIGVITDINLEDEEITVEFDIGEVVYQKAMFSNLTLAYAISIHKSQGSEFGLVIVPFSFKYWIMLKRKLIYTAITRAKKYLIMLGNVEALRRGITQIEEKRKTMLQERIHDMISNPFKILDTNSAFSEIKEENLNKVSISDFMDCEIQDINEMENITLNDFFDEGE
jgi:exodeoxyribonuclease V alpha subunit